MTRYRIDELAQASGVTVRNIRAYQDHGMLPGPQREGRVGIYTDAHLVRLRLITRLLGRGYTVATITELLNAWTHGREVSDILGLEQVVTGIWDEEIPASMSRAELYELFGLPESDAAPAHRDYLIDQAVRAAIVEPAGDNYRVASPRLLHAAAGLVMAGAPAEAVLELAGRLGRAVDGAVHGLLVAIYDQLLHGHDDDWIPSSSEIPEIITLVQRLRPLTGAAVSALLHRSLARNLDEVLGSYIARVMPNLRGDASTA